MKKARRLLQNFGRLNAKTADKFLATCLPFEAVILLYGSSNLSAKQKQPFYIYEYASWNPGVWVAKNPDKIGVYAEHIFFMFLLCLWWPKLLAPSNHAVSGVFQKIFLKIWYPFSNHRSVFLDVDYYNRIKEFFQPHGMFANTKKPTIIPSIMMK